MVPAANKELAEKVRLLVAEQLGVDESEVTPSASFVDDLGADSLDQVELIMAMEEAYKFEVSDEDVENMLTVKNAMDYVEKHGKVRK
jgi:acyl carrier protein